MRIKYKLKFLILKKAKCKKNNLFERSPNSFNFFYLKISNNYFYFKKDFYLKITFYFLPEPVGLGYIF
jgi:hypothetical protein